MTIFRVIDHGWCEVAVVVNPGKGKRLPHLFDPVAGLLGRLPEGANQVSLNLVQDVLRPERPVEAALGLS